MWRVPWPMTRMPTSPILRREVRLELAKLCEARYAKQVGELYVFLNTQQRSFQDKVLGRRDELIGQTYELGQKLKSYDSDSALRFDPVPIVNREMALRVELDGRLVRNPNATTLVRVFSPLQRALEPAIGDDQAMRQRSSQEPDAIYLRLADVPRLRSTLALAVATEETANPCRRQQRPAAPSAKWRSRRSSSTCRPCATRCAGCWPSQCAKATIFFRGSAYQLAAGDSAGEAVRATLRQLLPSIYPRFAEVSHRVGNEQNAVRAALAGNANNADLQALGVFHADGSLNEASPLLSALRARLPLAEQDQPPIAAGDLRTEYEKPPYGWDGNVVKVGLALLLRASACRLIDNGQVIADPADLRVVDLLTREVQFRPLRVQGVRAELTMPELIDCRTAMQQVFGAPLGTTPLVAATLHNVARRTTPAAGTAHPGSPAVGRHHPVPAPAGGGGRRQHRPGVAQHNHPQPPSPLVSRPCGKGSARWSPAWSMPAVFRLEQSTLFNQLRDFFNQMINAGVDLAAVRTFIADFAHAAGRAQFYPPGALE